MKSMTAIVVFVLFAIVANSLAISFDGVWAPVALIVISIICTLLAVVNGVLHGRDKGSAEGKKDGYNRGRFDALREGEEKARENAGRASGVAPAYPGCYKVRGIYPNRDGFHLWFENRATNDIRFHRTSDLRNWFFEPDTVRKDGLYSSTTFKVWRVGLFVYNTRNLLVNDEVADKISHDIYYDKDNKEIGKEEFDILQAEALEESRMGHAHR